MAEQDPKHTDPENNGADAQQNSPAEQSLPPAFPSPGGFTPPAPPAPQPDGAGYPQQFPSTQIPQQGQPYPGYQPSGQQGYPQQFPSTQIPGAQYGQPGPYPGAPQYQGWTPPVKPGLIPLHPLTLGNILGATFSVMRRNPRTTFGTALLVNGAIIVLTLLVVGVVSYFTLSNLDIPLQGNVVLSRDQAIKLLGAIGAIMLSAIIPAILGMAATTVLQGLLITAVAKDTVAQTPRLSDLMATAKGRIGALIAWAFLISAVMTMLVIIALIPVFIFGGSPATVGAGIMFTVLIMIALLIVGIWIGIKLCLVPAAIVLERATIRQAMSRSWSLTTDFFWRTLGIQLLVSIIVNVAAQIVTTPISMILGIVIGMMSPTGAMTDEIIPILIIFYLIIGILSLIIQTVTIIAASSVTGLLYIDLRFRKEGLHLDLARYVEQVQAGQATTDNPYLRDFPEQNQQPQYGQGF